MTSRQNLRKLGYLAKQHDEWDFSYHLRYCARSRVEHDEAAAEEVVSAAIMTRSRDGVYLRINGCLALRVL